MEKIFIVILCLFLGASWAFSQDKELPLWVQKLIQEYEKNPVANPPLSLSRCEYQEQDVYYVPPQCCDMPSSLYNEQGKKICSPDGGMSGDGDGKCSDFYETKKNCEVLWEDERTWPPQGSGKKEGVFR